MRTAKPLVANGRSHPSIRAVFAQLLPAVLVACLLAGAGVIHVSSRVWVVRTGYELSRLEQDARQLTREHDRLKLELATLRSPSRLERLAREKLVMGPPSPGTVFPVSSSRMTRSLSPPPRVEATALAKKDTGR